MSSATSRTVNAEDRAQIGRRLQLIGSIRRIMRAFDIRSRQMGATSDITLPQLLCLTAVVAEEGLTSREIARRVHVSPSTLVGVLDRLQEKRWVRRERDPDDRRRIHIQPTAAGRELIRAAPSALGESFDRAFGQLTDGRQRELVANVALMADLMTHQAEPGEDG